jgi:hypothetical protein
MAPLKIFLTAEAKMKRGNPRVLFPFQIIQLKLCPRLYTAATYYFIATFRLVVPTLGQFINTAHFQEAKMWSKKAN